MLIGPFSPRLDTTYCWKCRSRTSSYGQLTYRNCDCTSNLQTPVKPLRLYYGVTLAERGFRYETKKERLKERRKKKEKIEVNMNRLEEKTLCSKM
jgi:hypothetical protein